jgi:REP element-mobilizing transposase RayT
MAHTFSQLLYHVVFSTKNRHPFLDADLRERLFPYLGGIVGELGGKPVIVGGMPDHVHLLVSLSPAIALAEALRVVRTNSSRWVHETWPERRAFAWQTGYGAFSVSGSNQEAVVNYIANQEEHHHRGLSFQEEFVAFLKKHGIEYDPRFLWE